MASTPFNPDVFDQYAPTFTGADISALVILPQDEDRLNVIENYLNEVQQLLNDPDKEFTVAEATQAADSSLFLEPQGLGFSLLPLINLQSITVSTYRNKPQVRALGHVNPKGYARGSRTIAGTLILTEFDRDSFWTLIKQNINHSDNNLGDSGSAVLVDQIAPFDMVLLFQNEYGKAAYRYIYGIELSTNGIVYSIMDMYNENTLSFTAADATPLTPIEDRNLSGETLGSSVIGAARETIRIKNLGIVQSAREITRRFRDRERSRNPFR